MTDILSALLLFVIGAVAAVMNVMAGGGSVLTLPALIFLGLDSSVANGTNRVAIITQNVSAIYSFKRENHFAFKLSLKLSLWTLPGAIAGAFTAVKISDELFQTILGIIMIGIVISMLLPSPKHTPGVEPEKNSWMVYVSMLFIGFYGGFLQVGVGFLIMAAFHYLMHLNLVRINMHKVFIVFVFTVPALIIFILTNNVDWKLGISLAAGNATGGWWAAKLSVKKGERMIKVVLIAAVLIMSLKLLNVF